MTVCHYQFLQALLSLFSALSKTSIVLTRVFLTRNMVSLAAGFWYQHSRINLDICCRICEARRQHGKLV